MMYYEITVTHTGCRYGRVFRNSATDEIFEYNFLEDAEEAVCNLFAIDESIEQCYIVGYDLRDVPGFCAFYTWNEGTQSVDKEIAIDEFKQSPKCYR